MGIGAGKDYVLQLGDGAGSEAFTTIGGLRSTGFSFAAEGIEKTNIGSSQWKELLDGAGIKSVSISGSGVFTDHATEAQLRVDMLAQTLRNFRVLDDETNDYWQGAFKITSFERAGEYNGVITWSVSLESSGAVAFTQA